jgi:hypothetical protein
MAIKIKRSTGDLAPASLAAGQLAYSEGSTNGGTLYYGEIGGTVREIAGRKYVDKLNGIEAGAEVNTVDSVAGKTGAVTLDSEDITDFDTAVDARITSTEIIAKLDYTPEDADQKGVANGYASLDSSGLVPSSQLPSYVDDVIEGANLAAFPETGETGKIYVAVDTGKAYRWSGSVYIEIVASPGTTDALAEGSTNLYYTDARARAAISAENNVSYEPSTGVITGPDISTVGFTGSYDDLIDKPTLFSGSYEDLTDTPTLFSGDYEDLSGKPTLFSGSYTDLTDKPTLFTDLVQDTTPQLGGNLDVAGNSIVSTSNGNINISPDGTGTVSISKSTSITSGNLSVPNGGISGGGLSIVTNTYSSSSSFAMAQAHSTADANNFTLLRARGTWATQSAVQSGDELAEFAVAGNDGSATTSAGQKAAWGFTTVMTDNPSTNLLPHRTDWLVNTTAGAQATYMSIANDAVVRVREIGTVSDVSDLVITAGTDGDIVLSPGAAGAVFISGLSYPTADGDADQVLTTDGEGNLSWTDQVGGITDIVEDTTPQLGGNLDLNGNKLVTVSNGGITLAPNGSGTILLNEDGTGPTIARRTSSTGTGAASLIVQRNFTGDVLANMNEHLSAVGFSQRDSAGATATYARIGALYLTDGAHGVVMDISTNGFTTSKRIFEAIEEGVVVGDGSAGDEKFVTTAGSQNLVLNTNFGATDAAIGIEAGANGNIVLIPDGTGHVIISDLSFPNADGTADQVLKTDGAGNLSWVDQSAGVTTFVALTDTPSAFTGSGGYYVKVNSGATALEFSQDVDDGTF